MTFRNRRIVVLGKRAIYTTSDIQVELKLAALNLKKLVHFPGAL